MKYYRGWKETELISFVPSIADYILYHAGNYWKLEFCLEERLEKESENQDNVQKDSRAQGFEDSNEIIENFEESRDREVWDGCL